MIKKIFFLLLFIVFGNNILFAQDVAILKYDGGGDWYANPTAVPNLIEFCNKNINTVINKKPKTVATNSIEIFNYPIVFMTGHGNVDFNADAVENLRNYLISGGFLHVSDNYGIDKYLRREMKKIFPELEFQEIPNNHKIYNQEYHFKQLPKIHEHDNKPAQGFGIFYQGKLVVFYDYQCDLSDGWEDAEVHHNPQEIREKALKMGANIISYAFLN